MYVFKKLVQLNIIFIKNFAKFLCLKFFNFLSIVLPVVRLTSCHSCWWEISAALFLEETRQPSWGWSFQPRSEAVPVNDGLGRRGRTGWFPQWLLKTLHISWWSEERVIWIILNRSTCSLIKFCGVNFLGKKPLKGFSLECSCIINKFKL